MRRAAVPGRRTRRAAHVRGARCHRADDPQADPRLPGRGRGGLLGAHARRDGGPWPRVPPDHRGPGESGGPGVDVRRKGRRLRAGRRARVLPAPALGRVPGPGTARRGGRGMSAPTLAGVGMGPGDPELVTVKAVRVLREADVVLVPVLATQEPGRAETIIREYVPADQIRRLEFALNDTGGVTPRRAAAWQAAATAVAEEFAAGAATVAFGTLGDPNLYSTFSYLAQTVRELVPGVTVETVAGITAMQDLASRAGISLAEGTEPVTLVPLNGGVAGLDQALARGGTVVGYKVGAAASPAPAILRARLQAAGRLERAIIGARLGLPGELIAPAAKLLRPPPQAPAPPTPV